MIRGLRQIARDATLRLWLLERALGRAPAPRPFAPHKPPYLSAIPVADEARTPAGASRELSASPPTAPLALSLPGAHVDIDPAEAGAAFGRDYADTETLLALHRFAWLPLAGPGLDLPWAAVLWRAWRERFAEPDATWAWHPYTAAERAVNLLACARRHGWFAPAGETRDILARHAPAIAARLEYFGETNTGNHLANNGRGLFALGLDLGLPDYADMGATILIEEAQRIFRPSGILREGSSHYHLLLARNYAEAWLWARRHGHRAVLELESIVRRALAAAAHLRLPGGLPLIGDISPDCPPDHLAALLPGGNARRGWGAWLDDDERAAFLALRDSVSPSPAGALAEDGWLEASFGPWAGLWFLAPDGFAPMPGHGHQDAGGFELHWRDIPLFVDLGRGAYGDEGEAAFYRSARVHNVLTLDDADPYPPNKPYYDSAFRRRHGGMPTTLARENDGIVAAFKGFARLGATSVRRRWRFLNESLILEDAIDGEGRRRIARRLHTPWPVDVSGGDARIRAPGAVASVRVERATPTLDSATRWTAYGQGAPAAAIVFEDHAPLPWRGALTVTVEAA
jgi:hypothetical protein